MPEIGEIRVLDFGRKTEVWIGNGWMEIETLRNREDLKEVRDKIFGQPQLMVKDLMEDLETGSRMEEVIVEKIKEAKAPRRQDTITPFGSMGIMGISTTIGET